MLFLHAFRFRRSSSTARGWPLSRIRIGRLASSLEAVEVAHCSLLYRDLWLFGRAEIVEKACRTVKRQLDCRLRLDRGGAVESVTIGASQRESSIGTRTTGGELCTERAY